MDVNAETLKNCLTGIAVGDALGLPYENLSPARAQRLLGEPSRYRFLFGRGMVSDDTEHSCIIAQCLIASAGNPAIFERQLARRLRRWFLCLPAGIGRATLRSCLKLCVGFSPENSGVFSAGNGPAMRAAIIGAAVEDVDLAMELNRVSSRITHTDPVAELGAAVVVLAAWGTARKQFNTPTDFFDCVRNRFAHVEAAASTLKALAAAEASIQMQQSTTDFCAEFCGSKGASGYVLQTVPVAIHSWLSNRTNPDEAIRQLIRCGGDTDSTAAIAGGICGCESPVNSELVQEIRDAPINIRFANQLAEQLSEVMSTGTQQRPVQSSLPVQLIRNAVFLGTVYVHTFRRLLPPY